MAEVMLLLIFCLLIALAASLHFEQKKLAAAEAVKDEQGVSVADRNLITAIKQNTALYEKLRETAASPKRKAIDEFWRDLVANQSTSAQIRELGLSADQLRDKVKEADALQAKGADAATALRDVDIVSTIQSVMPNDGSSPNAQAIKEMLQKGLDAKNSTGHQWPPIIDLSEANGHYFKVGSAELSPDFRTELMAQVPERIKKYIQEYDVDVIEVVGHTDEQPIGSRPSNLDQGLVPVLRNGATIGSLVPADNAGLGLARAVSVVSVLRQSKLLEGYKLIPLSGAQLVNTDETLALTGSPGNIRERRRIEIRLRKSTPHDSPVQEVLTTAPDMPLPRPRPILPIKPKPHLPAPALISSRPLPPTLP